MYHDSSVLRYQCWRDYMNEDYGVMIVRVYGACVFLNYFPINKSGSTHIGPMVIWTRVCVIVGLLYACVYHLLPSAISWTPVNRVNPRTKIDVHNYGK